MIAQALQPLRQPEETDAVPIVPPCRIDHVRLRHAGQDVLRQSMTEVVVLHADREIDGEPRPLGQQNCGRSMIGE